MRADHLAEWGAPRDTMPRLAAWARRNATRVERSVAVSPNSLESHGSMFTGLLPSRHGGRKPGLDDPTPPVYAYPLPASVPTLAGALSRAGYVTVGIAANFGILGAEYGLPRGFAHYEAFPGSVLAPAVLDPYRFALHGRWPLAGLDRVRPFRDAEFFEWGVPWRRAPEIAERAISVLGAVGDAPYFLFLNFFDAHAPYRPPVAFEPVYPGTRRQGWTAWEEEEERAREATGASPVTAAERDAWLAAYDSSLSYLDAGLERFLVALEKTPRFAETLVIVTADHGEAFGEHGVFRHSNGLWDELVKVPTWIKPGRRAPPSFVPSGRVPGPFQSTDVYPTVLDHARLDVPPGLDGTAWAAERTVTFAEAYIRRAVSDRSRDRFQTEQRTVERDGWKLLLDRKAPTRLFHLPSDPAERLDRAAERPDLVRALAALVGTGPARPPVPAAEKENLARLRALGYLR